MCEKSFKIYSKKYEIRLQKYHYKLWNWEPFLTKSTVWWTPSTPHSVDTIFNDIHGIMDTIRNVDTIFNEIHVIVDTIRSVDNIFNEIHGQSPQPPIFSSEILSKIWVNSCISG